MNSLDRKINLLFRERGVEELAQQLLDAARVTIWHDLAVNIQRRIYLLDYHYETSYSLGTANEDRLWAHFNDASILIPSAEGRGALEQGILSLKKYGQYEARIHNFDLFDTDELYDISKKKSADVSLARNLIYSLCDPEKAPDNTTRYFFRLFDQFSEIVEDLQDMEEDFNDWNLNFWLTSIRQGGDIKPSIDNACFTLFLIAKDIEQVWGKMDLKYHGLCARYWKKVCADYSSIKANQQNIYTLLSNANYITYSDLSRDPLILDTPIHGKVKSLCEEKL